MQVELNTVISVTGLLITLGGFVALWAGVISKMRTQLDLLWEIYVTDALRKQRQAGLVESRSPTRLSAQVWQDIKDKGVLDIKLINRTRALVAKGKPLPHSDAQLIVWYMEKMGFSTLTDRASRRDISLEEYLAQVVTYLRELERGEDSLRETLGV